VSIIVIALPLQGRLSAQLSILFIFTVTLCGVYIFIRNKYTKKRVIKISETSEEEEF
jgi:Ca2+/Na+ antiporter